MRNFIILLFFGFIISLTSCRSDFDFEASNGGLRFSRDTVYLDTVFTNIGSSTYTLKVYNRSDKNISIPTIQLGKGLDSKYRMTVDGMQGENGKIFHNVEMLAKDSLYIFIETTVNIADANPDDFLYTDQIQFGAGTTFQKVELVTLIQDAIFLYPQRDDAGVYETVPAGIDAEGNEIRKKGFYLDETELEWTNQKPYVIYGYAGVPAGETLNIAAGTRVHFHAESALIAYNGATININGTPSTDAAALENEVIFEGDRLEPEFSEIQGQWLAIWLTQGSRGNFTNFTLKNSTIGILVSGNDNSDYSLNLKNVQIYNASNYGIVSHTGHIKGENVVIGTTGLSNLLLDYGGKYNFTHSTFYNSSQSSSSAAVRINNFLDDAIPETMPLEEATFNNCIIYGTNQFELLLEKREGNATFNYFFNHCLIKFNTFNTNAPDYGFEEPLLFNSCYIATDSFTLRPRFWDANNNKLNITLESEAIQKADPAFIVPFDVLNVPRSTNDIGAYQSADPPGEN